MPNKVILKNKLTKVADEDVAAELEKEAKKRMLWIFQKEPKEPKEPKEK